MRTRRHEEEQTDREAAEDLREGVGEKLPPQDPNPGTGVALINAALEGMFPTVYSYIKNNHELAQPLLISRNSVYRGIFWPQGRLCILLANTSHILSLTLGINILIEKIS